MVVDQVKMRDVAPLKKLRVIVEPKSSARKSWYLKEVGLVYTCLLLSALGGHDWLHLFVVPG